MQKLSVKNGSMLSCGWPPPLPEIDVGFMLVLAEAPAMYVLVGPLAQTPPAGSVLVPAPELPRAGCECIGS